MRANPRSPEAYAPSQSCTRQRLLHQDRHRQRHRLGERQHAADEVDLPQRHPGDGQELLPLQHPGPAHLVRDPRHPGRARGALRPDRPHGRHERRDLCARRQGGRAGRLPAVRLHLAAAGAAEARRHHRARRAAGAAVQRELQRGAHPHPDEEHLLRRGAGGAARAGPRAHPHAAGRDLRQEAAAGREQHEGHPARLRLRAHALPLPAAAARGEDGRAPPATS